MSKHKSKDGKWVRKNRLELRQDGVNLGTKRFYFLNTLSIVFAFSAMTIWIILPRYGYFEDIPISIPISLFIAGGVLELLHRRLNPNFDNDIAPTFVCELCGSVNGKHEGEICACGGMFSNINLLKWVPAPAIEGLASDGQETEDQDDTDHLGADTDLDFSYDEELQVSQPLIVQQRYNLLGLGKFKYIRRLGPLFLIVLLVGFYLLKGDTSQDAFFILVGISILILLRVPYTKFRLGLLYKSFRYLESPVFIHLSQKEIVVKTEKEQKSASWQDVKVYSDDYEIISFLVEGIGLVMISHAGLIRKGFGIQVKTIIKRYAPEINSSEGMKAAHLFRRNLISAFKGGLP